MSSERRRDLDIVLFGATGFVGRLVAEHLAQTAPPGTRIALAGRSPERLAQVRDGLGEQAASWPLVVADSTDRPALDAMARRARVVATTVGPYAKHGMPLAAACAEAGTHYADLTGEVLFVHEVARRHEATARHTGARLVHACGFDSVPSDLSVHLLHERATADGAGGLGDTTLLVERLQGGLSGGTVDSVRGQVETVRRDRAARRLAADPYALVPDRAAAPSGRSERDRWDVVREGGTGRWLAPFVMAAFNSRIVRRSDALLGHAYGERFRYRERLVTGRGPRGYAAARAVQAGTAALVAGLASPLGRPLLDHVLPKPGEGPSAQRRAAGGFRMRTVTTADNGHEYQVVFAAQGDPGYAATAVMLGQAALCLALDGDRLPDRSGVLTPATAMGGALADRLREQGFTIEVTG